MILSQITRSDVRFELLLCTSKAENLSPVVASVSQSVSVSVPIGPGITVVAIVGISIGLGSSGGLGISGSLSIVGITMMGIGVSSVSEKNMLTIYNIKDTTQLFLRRKIKI